MASPNYHMWPYWRDKYFDPVEAIRDYYSEVLAAEEQLRREVIRIDAYKALIDKLMAEYEDRRLTTEADAVPLWSVHRDDYGYVGALQERYANLLEENEPLRVALNNIVDANTEIETWMAAKAGADESAGD